ncbi:hypothetical protein CC2G_008153 [Coprinopsis cinerea AmutBmut pab1-1]|nr:hypothetical protein CC2G_008153 [Coprinopsis cinerea AmutBmut pab1-1]
MSSTPSTPGPANKPERSFSLTKLKGALRRNSRHSIGATASEPSGDSSVRQSLDSTAASTTTPPTGTTSTPASPRKTPSIRRVSLDLARPSRHGRSASVSIVPSTQTTSDKASDFDPFAESHDDKGKRTWSVRKTVKGALKRTTSKLSVASATSATKSVEGGAEAVSEPQSIQAADSAAAEQTATPPPVGSATLEAASSTEQQASAPQEPTETPAEPAPQPTPEPDAVVAKDPEDPEPKPTEETKEAASTEEEKPTAQELQLAASTTGLDWEHVDAESSPVVDDKAKEVIEEDPVPSKVDDILVVPAIVEPESPVEVKLPPLDVTVLSRTHLTASHLRSEFAELSPIIESPLTARDENAPVSIQITSDDKPVASSPLAASSTTAEEPEEPAPVVVHEVVSMPEPIVSAPEPVQTSVAPEVAASSSQGSQPPSSPRSKLSVDTTPASALPIEVPSPNLNAAEQGKGLPTANGNASTSSDADAANKPREVVNHFDLRGPSTVATTDTNATSGAYGLIANTAWFVGACVVVGIGVVVGQVRSYRQVLKGVLRGV